MKFMNVDTLKDMLLNKNLQEYMGIIEQIFIVSEWIFFQLNNIYSKWRRDKARRLAIHRDKRGQLAQTIWPYKSVDHGHILSSGAKC